MNNYRLASQSVVDKLAQFIRQVDGNNKMGAGALADKICERFRVDAPSVQGEIVAEIVIESDYWNRGHFYEGRRKELKVVSSIQDLPVGTKLYAAGPQTEMLDVARLVEALEWLRGAINATPENDKYHAGTWISSKHPRIKQIDAILAAHRKQRSKEL